MMSRNLLTSNHRRLVPAILLPLLLAPGAAPASGQGGSEEASGLQSPYSGQKDVAVTGLLPDEVEALTLGQGMAQALPAEVNDYPGPLHVLEAAEEGTLDLEPEQRREVERIYDRMHELAVAKGREVLDAEALLARRFRHRHIDAAVLREIVDRTARLRGELRSIHLLAHLETRALMTAAQVTAYRALRGYDDPGGHADHHQHAPGS